MEKQIRNSLLLLITATIWGTAFVAQSVGMETVEPLIFNAVRCLIGGLFLVLFLWLWNKKHNASDEQSIVLLDRNVLTAGILCGLAFTMASNLQAYGVKYTTVGKAGFITACYIVIVPILGLFLKKKVNFRIWFAVAISLLGLYLLCIGERFEIGLGDLLVLGSAVLFSIHILVIDHYASQVNGVLMSCIQFIVCGCITLTLALLFETIDIVALFQAWWPLFYAGVMSCGVAYTLQIIGQKDMNPTIAALILSLESCISVLAGWILLNERLTLKEGFGCVLMFCAIVIAQLPKRNKKVNECKG